MVRNLFQGLLVTCVVIICSCSSPVNVLSIVDESSVESCLIKIYSIIKSATPTRSLNFGFLVVGDHDNSIEDTIRRAFRTCHFRGDITIKHWVAPRAVQNLTQDKFDKDVIYARFYLPHIFNEMDRYIYLDNDLVVNCDVSVLFDTSLISGYGTGSLEPIRTNSRIPGAQETNVAGFVFDRSRFYAGYLSSHLNTQHPLVQRLFHVRSNEIFLNGGVALIDAATWRRDGYTARAEKLIAQNRHSFIFDSSISDQGLFALLLLHRVTHLHPKYNMRRLPNKTVLLLEKQELGIVHFAGSTNGEETYMCRHPTQYPNFIPAAMPLYFSVVNSLFTSCPAISWKMKEVCAEGMITLEKYLSSENISVVYNAGRGKFTWPVQ